MFHVKRALYVVVLIILVSCACRLLPGRQVVVPDVEQYNSEVEMPDSGEVIPDIGMVPGFEEAGWPSYLPSEIPELEGDIDLVMVARESHIRIFYDKVEEEVLLAYLDQLENAGYSLEYLVYAEPGFEASAEERAAAGEYDAVDITNGEYHMRLGYGAGTAVYDIYIQGFSVPEDPSLLWPEELIGLLPQPDNCALQRVDTITSGEYRIQCQPESENTSPDYVILLQQNEYIESDCSPLVYEIGNPQTLAYQNICVTVLTISESEMQIEVQKNASFSDDQWPAVLRDVVPAPERTSIESVMAINESDYHMVAAAEDSDVLQEYMGTLETAGFEKGDTFKGPGGELISITLSDGEWAIEIMPSAMGLQIIIHIYKE